MRITKIRGCVPTSDTNYITENYFNENAKELFEATHKGETFIYEDENVLYDKLYALYPEDLLCYIMSKRMALSYKIRTIKKHCRQSSIPRDPDFNTLVRYVKGYDNEMGGRFTMDLSRFRRKDVYNIAKATEVLRIKELRDELKNVRLERHKFNRLYTIYNNKYKTENYG